MSEQFLHGVEVVEIDPRPSATDRGGFPGGVIGEDAIILCDEVIPE